MSKREREEVPVTPGPTTTHWAVRDVLHMGDLVRLIASSPVLELMDVWNLYRSYSFALRALKDDPDICVFREARLHYNGGLYKPLKRALKKGDPGLARCLVVHLSQHPVEGSVAYYACGTSLEYAKVVYSILSAYGSGDLDYCLASSLSRGNVENFRRVEEWALRVDVTDSIDYVDTLHMLIGLGLVDIALAAKPDNVTEGEWIDQLWLSSSCDWSSTLALEYVAETRPETMRQFLDNWHMTVGTDLVLIKWLVGYARRIGHPVNYEEWYVHCMQTEEPGTEPRGKILQWLKPLALQQFLRRRKVDPTAQPDPNNLYFTTVFPGVRDRDHYAYDHFENIAGFRRY